MHARFTGMTLQTVLRQHGITTIKELMHRTGWSRQYSWNLWHGYDGVGKETMRRLHTSLGIPLEALLQIDPVPARHRTTPPRPHGRPKKPRPEATP
jgi:transcriptional regulator with XRE-family HTH domain